MPELLLAAELLLGPPIQVIDRYLYSGGAKANVVDADIVGELDGAA